MVYQREMVAAIREDPHLGQLVTDDVLRAMATVPRHLFANARRLAEEYGLRPESEKFYSHVYNPHMSIPITPTVRESAPEILGVQLSMVGIGPGDHVLVIGAKGGYIQSLTAELVGHRGAVCTYSSDARLLKRNARLCGRFTPYGNVLHWFHGQSVHDPQPLARQFGSFDRVVVCGAVTSFPLEYLAVLAPHGRVLVPVGGKNAQRLMSIEETDGKYYKRVVQDWQVVFGPVV